MANLKQIEKYLKSKKISYKVIELGGEVFTVKGVAKTGVDEEEIVKTLVIRTNNRFVALAVKGRDRLDFKKVRKLFGSKTELAKPAEVLKICKVPVGAVCPILLNIPVYSERKNSGIYAQDEASFERRSENHDLQVVGIYFDRKVMNLKRVNMGSGDLTRGLEMEFSDLLKAVREPQVEDLIKI